MMRNDISITPATLFPSILTLQAMGAARQLTGMRAQRGMARISAPAHYDDGAFDATMINHM